MHDEIDYSTTARSLTQNICLQQHIKIEKHSRDESIGQAKPFASDLHGVSANGTNLEAVDGTNFHEAVALIAQLLPDRSNLSRVWCQAGEFSQPGVHPVLGVEETRAQRTMQAME